MILTKGFFDKLVIGPHTCPIFWGFSLLRVYYNFELYEWNEFNCSLVLVNKKINIYKGKCNAKKKKGIHLQRW